MRRITIFLAASAHGRCGLFIRLEPNREKVGPEGPNGSQQKPMSEAEESGGIKLPQPNRRLSPLCGSI